MAISRTSISFVAKSQQFHFCERGNLILKLGEYVIFVLSKKGNIQGDGGSDVRNLKSSSLPSHTAESIMLYLIHDTFEVDTYTEEIGPVFVARVKTSAHWIRNFNKEFLASECHLSKPTTKLN
jgi:hypothetical protein